MALKSEYRFSHTEVSELLKKNVNEMPPLHLVPQNRAGHPALEENGEARHPCRDEETGEKVSRGLPVKVRHDRALPNKRLTV